MTCLLSGNLGSVFAFEVRKDLFEILSLKAVNKSKTTGVFIRGVFAPR
jgi:hypothetical protein